MVQCKATIKTGHRKGLKCKYKAKKRSKYCGKHKKQKGGGRREQQERQLHRQRIRTGRRLREIEGICSQTSRFCKNRRVRPHLRDALDDNIPRPKDLPYSANWNKWLKTTYPNYKLERMSNRTCSDLDHYFKPRCNDTNIRGRTIAPHQLYEVCNEDMDIETLRRKYRAAGVCTLGRKQFAKRCILDKGCCVDKEHQRNINRYGRIRNHCAKIIKKKGFQPIPKQQLKLPQKYR